MSDVIPFPRPRRLGVRPADQPTSTIPFGPVAMREIASRLTASAPEILDATVGSVVIASFMDYLWKLAGGAALALLLCLACATPGWAQAPAQSLCCGRLLLPSPLDPSALASAEAEIQHLDDLSREAQKGSDGWSIEVVAVLRLSLIASEEETKHPVEVAQGVELWKPALSKAWWVCALHLAKPAPLGSGSSPPRYEPLFQDACPAVQAQYDRAKEVVGYVLAKRAAAPDLATIARAGAGGGKP